MQHLVMTPQLKQAIAMLRSSREELLREIEAEIAATPALTSAPRHVETIGPYRVGGNPEPDAYIWSEGDRWRAAASSVGVPEFFVYGRKVPCRPDEPDGTPEEYEAREADDEAQWSAATAGLTGEEREKARAAAWFVRAIQQRGRALRALALALTRACRPFFVYNPDHLERVALRVLAEETAMHESTIERLVAGKYVRTPHGTFPFEAFVKRPRARRA